MRGVVFAALIGCTSSVLIPCLPPVFVGSQKQFVVEQENGKNRRTVPAVEGTESAASFYSYTSASSHTGLEVLGGSSLFLYRDISNPNSKLDLFWIQGIELNTQLHARVHGLITGVPSGVSVAQSDDDGEFGWTSGTTPGAARDGGPHLSGNWYYAYNTDGGAITGLPLDQDWELKIEAVFVSGHVNTWQFFFGDGSTPLTLDVNEPAYLKPVVTPIGNNGVQQYPQTPSTETYCALVTGSGPTYQYTFSWGDGTPDDVIEKPLGEVACATHTFCGAISGSCGGVYPRMVVVSVLSTDPLCLLPPATKILANEELNPETCRNNVAVRLNGMPVAGSGVMEGGRIDLHHIPEQFSSTEQFMPDVIEQNDVLELVCCGAGDCEFIVSTYHCPPCSGSMNGGYPGSLPTSGFVAGSCSPRFGSDNNRMTSFHTIVNGASSLPLPAASVHAPYVVVFGKKGSIDNWCPTTGQNNCGGPCPPSICICNL